MFAGFAGEKEELAKARPQAAQTVQRIYNLHQALKVLKSKGRLTPALAKRQKELAKFVAVFLEAYKGTIRSDVQKNLESVVAETPGLVQGLGFVPFIWGAAILGVSILGLSAAAITIALVVRTNKETDLQKTEALIEAKKEGIDLSSILGGDGGGFLGNVKGIIGLLLLGGALWIGKGFLPKSKAA